MGQLKLLLLQRESIQFGSEAPSYPHSQPSRKCGLKRKNTMKRDLPSYTENARKLLLFFFCRVVSFIPCFFHLSFFRFVFSFVICIYPFVTIWSLFIIKVKIFGIEAS